ncbi:MAG TPA: CPBP family intramembrane glutamic endopeptidase [Mucilaginibacter sp.]|nr:CPBP family intramembrane glutamic endopeptidase [Mucilaginibacter sp.]
MDEQVLILPKRRYGTLIIIAGIAIAILFYPVVGTLVLNKKMDPVFRIFISRLIIWATLPLVYRYAVKVEQRDFLLWKETTRRTYFYIAAVAVLFLLIFGAQIIASVPRYLGFHDNVVVLKYWNDMLRHHLFLFVFTCFTAGVTEELLIRGYVLPRLSLLFKSGYQPVIISSLLFSLLHIGYRNLGECIFTFVFGIICAVCYQKYRNIKLLMLFHFLYDLIILV